MLILIALIAVGIAALRPKVTQVTDLKVGTGPAVKKGDSVEVHYVGKLSDGSTFDSSKSRGQPITLGVGQGMVIKGWESGLVGMKAGGVRRLVIPPEEGYGPKGAPPAIPPNATLDFEVELLKIH
ncbi:FKBP-type peptidyl-prolyl cis-trans isomerase [Tundrisphaera lichenicola]|uniref:FKBP-type peptidyl-prolyl cis-trans isomerase n=1 Tax=Tundrisphaera lichenicola TaxID=2029860 RepID=UPI003EBF6577